MCFDFSGYAASARVVYHPYAGETFLSWNRAFVRADDHVLSFFCLSGYVIKCF